MSPAAGLVAVDVTLALGVLLLLAARLPRRRADERRYEAIRNRRDERLGEVEEDARN